MPEPSDTKVAPVTTEDAAAPRHDREFAVKERSQWKMAFRRFLKHRIAVVSVFVFVLLVLFAFVGPHFWQFTYKLFTNDLSQGPSRRHPFGTDSNGYDEVALIMRGHRRSR